MLIRWVIIGLILPVAVTAQEPNRETLADIRQELEVVHVMVQTLRRELATTKSPGLLNARGSFQERIDTIESALQRLTARTEELENRVERIVADGTNRIGDLEFRLVELEGGDISALGETTTLGGTGSSTAAVDIAKSAPAQTTPELAVSEKDDFNRALAAYESEDFPQAVRLFATFNNSYPSGPLAGAAHLYRGLSLDAQGEVGEAARAYLEAYSVSPEGPEAPLALLQLGLSLNALGKSSQACVTLNEIAVLFPDDAMVVRAEDAQREIGCL